MNINAASCILVYKLLGSSIQTREASSVLIELVQQDPCSHVELDFSSVVYISRSFADQFHFDKINCATNFQKVIIVSNASEEVVKMLQAVAKSQNLQNRKMEAVPVFKYSSYNELESFLLTF